GRRRSPIRDPARSRAPLGRRRAARGGTRVTGSRFEAASLDLVRRRWKVPALAAGLVHADGGLELGVVGERRRGNPGDPVREDDPWHVGSCAKAMTAVALARLIERGD